MQLYIPCTPTNSRQKGVDLEFAKLLAPFITPVNLQHIESHSLAQRSTLPNCNQIPLLDTETRRNMSRKILMSLLVPIILLHEMEIIATKDAR